MEPNLQIFQLLSEIDNLADNIGVDLAYDSEKHEMISIIQANTAKIQEILNRILIQDILNRIASEPKPQTH